MIHITVGRGTVVHGFTGYKSSALCGRPAYNRNIAYVSNDIMAPITCKTCIRIIDKTIDESVDEVLTEQAAELAADNESSPAPQLPPALRDRVIRGMALLDAQYPAHVNTVNLNMLKRAFTWFNPLRQASHKRYTYALVELGLTREGARARAFEPFPENTIEEHAQYAEEWCRAYTARRSGPDTWSDYIMMRDLDNNDV